MTSRTVAFLVDKRTWSLVLGIIFVVSIIGVAYLGYGTYAHAPPTPEFTDREGRVVVSETDILDGQEIFHRYALMSYGTMFGDGALRGPDFTADALHHVGRYMREYHRRQFVEEHQRPPDEVELQSLANQVRDELRVNRHRAETDRVPLTDAQVYAFDRLVEHYQAVFNDPEYEQAFRPTGYITDPAQLRQLTAFFFWGGWVCVVDRPGFDFSYTHNWPYDESVGNVPTTANIIWSLIGILALFLGLGAVMYVYGQFDELPGEKMEATSHEDARPLGTGPTFATQRATYKYFAVAVGLFFIQVAAGVLTIHDFLGFVEFFGVDISEFLPITVVRAWHTQMSILWIALCWIGVSIYLLPIVSKEEPPGQLRLVNILFGLLVLVGVGSFVGIIAGPSGWFGEYWYWFGTQGWEYLEMGRAWQIVLFLAFVLWAAIVYRGLVPVLSNRDQWSLPRWLLYCIISVVLLLISSFMIRPEASFVINDFWRWMVVHMWVEAFFEVLTTILVGWVLVLMGLVKRSMAERAVYLAAVLFLGSGLLGISHNFYWNAKPTGALALGAVFSSLQVVPLLLLTLDAWKLRRIRKKSGTEDKNPTFLHGVWLFILGVNFWNFLGAGVFGFIINLPIVNYFEHATYLTVNHAHAALMGVYGNLSVAAMLFCCQRMIHHKYWNPKLVHIAFWSLNAGLMLMVVLDLFPVGVWQLWAVIEEGFWFARSPAFVESLGFHTFTWLRAIGGNLFFWGGLIPLIWFIWSRYRVLGTNVETR